MPPDSQSPTPDSVDRIQESWGIKPSKTSRLAKILWSWTVVGAVVVLLLGGGISMSAHVLVADGFFGTGFALLLAKFVTWEEARSHKRGVIPIGAAAILLLCGGAIWGNHRLNKAESDAAKKKTVAPSTSKAPAPSSSVTGSSMQTVAPTGRHESKSTASSKTVASDENMQDVRLEFARPVDPQISVRSTGSGLVREPRYTLMLSDLDKAVWDETGVLPALRTYVPSFTPSDWLRPGDGFGGYAMFDAAHKPMIDSRLFGWATCTCPLCATERTYLVFIVFGKSGWSYEVPQGKSINRPFFNSLFGKGKEEQKALLSIGIPENERIQFAP